MEKNDQMMMIKTAKRIAAVEEYYFSRKLAEVKKLDSPEMPVINLGIGSPDLPPSPESIEALAASAQQPGSHGYQSYKGIPAFRQGIAKFYQDIYHTDLNPDTEILPLMGSKEGIMHISMAFVDEGDEVLVPNPGYPTYSSVTRLTGGVIRPYVLDEATNWGIDVAALRNQDLSRVKIMWLNFPHMPTGRVASREELASLVALAREREFLLVNDNPYSLILNDQPLSLLSLDGARDVSLELNSLSKSHNMAGWRLGWLAGKQAYVDAVLRVKSNMDSGMFLGLQQAAVKSLANGASWFASLNETYRQRKNRAEAILTAMGCSFSTSQSGLFVWAKAPDAVADVEKWIDEILYGTKVFITPGFIFGDAGGRYVRISLCSPVSVLDEALSRITKFVNRPEVSVNQGSR